MARLKEIVVDALHPAALARFWAAPLDGYAVRPCRSRIHFDVACESRSREVA